MEKKTTLEKGLFRLYIIPNVIGVIVLGIAAYYFSDNNLGLWIKDRSGLLTDVFGCHAYNRIGREIDHFYFLIKTSGALLLLPWVLHFFIKKIASPLFHWFASGFTGTDK